MKGPGGSPLQPLAVPPPSRSCWWATRSGRLDATGSCWEARRPKGEDDSTALHPQQPARLRCWQQQQQQLITMALLRQGSQAGVHAVAGVGKEEGANCTCSLLLLPAVKELLLLLLLLSRLLLGRPLPRLLLLLLRQLLLLLLRAGRLQMSPWPVLVAAASRVR